MVDYRGKLVLAPMVRAGELPTRLLALKYGADLVWGPEIIDKKILTCDRIINEKLGTIDYLSKGQTKIPGVTNLVFRTFPPKENSKLIFQMGTSNPDLAVQAAEKIINDVNGIDINAGCPKHFSIHAGMGAALLKTPDLLVSILKNLVEKIGKPNSKPISVKIRLFPQEEDSLTLISKLLKTGISNLTVHCRTQPMRNREPPIRSYIDKIKKLCDDHNVTLIINGALNNRKEFYELQKTSWGEDVGGMIATEAEINPSCFSETPLNWPELIKEYTKLAESFDNYIGNTKYMLTRMTPGRSLMYQLVARAKSYEEFYKVFEKLNDDGTLKNVDDIQIGKKNKQQQKPQNKQKKEVKETKKDTKPETQSDSKVEEKKEEKKEQKDDIQESKKHKLDEIESSLDKKQQTEQISI
ncbi:tRNA-dihydrouridine synthase [Wickerhamomyces ciferrii]|uniref:tRNA-dihydrouridine synthase n=1 Tax=Wickerhamomyces ciferrii (strain ATCC 14091 / BCRC 22168 / CBS 111 / JCM 3599 / NBRC 0793 / NRRL Y-1031 F-60-10) TaxID=1206466 RepID=K0KLF3_WICCF|nr:tRNA-dihydrouridine synthase [Wickerhamomyces ciferrii]CCH41948.1 tRNA-dihydrouridine synthase [Wickerhamomyces ciferrii]